MHRLRTLGALALLAACGPNPKPAVVMALVPDETNTLSTRQVELTTVGNATTLTGDVITFRGSTTVDFNSSDPLQANLDTMSDDQVYDTVVKEKGGEVRVHYIDRSGVLWPADFHSWSMVSAYYNFERAYQYFNDVYPDPDQLGKGAQEILPLKVQYWADVRFDGNQVKDNALFLSFIHSFVLMPFDQQQKVPLPMNLGVIAHETAHQVFNVRALKKQAFPDYIGTWNGLPFNFLKSLDEGLADFHGYSATCLEVSQCQPRFLAPSWNDDRTVAMRDVSRNDACMTLDMYDASMGTGLMTTTNQSTWTSSQNMYKVGNIVASALFHAGGQSGKMKELQTAIIAAYDDDSNSTPGLRQWLEVALQQGAPPLYPMEEITDLFAAHISDPALRGWVCGELSYRLNLHCPSGQGPCPIDSGSAGSPNLMPHCQAKQGEIGFVPKHSSGCN
jgi:hypothetical protein